MHWTLANAAANLKRRAKKRERPRGLPLPALWLVTDESRLPDPMAALAQLPRGAGLILRHYGVADRTLLAKRLAAACRRRGVALLIAGDWRLAASVGAAGVHLGEHAARRGLSSGGSLWLRLSRKLLTVAAHGPRGLRRAVQLNAAAAVLAPIFKTASHPSRIPLGIARAAALVRKTSVPVLALGGVTASTIKGLQHSGCAGVAGIGFAYPPNSSMIDQKRSSTPTRAPVPGGAVSGGKIASGVPRLSPTP